MAKNTPSLPQGGRTQTDKTETTPEQAIAWLERYHTNKDIQWSREVLMKDGYVCRDCGELIRELLEASHIKPKAQFPELAYVLDNGRTRCLLCHARKHTGWARLMILARLALILYRQQYPKKDLSDFNDILGKKCQNF